VESVTYVSLFVNHVKWGASSQSSPQQVSVHEVVTMLKSEVVLSSGRVEAVK
jgi:hypothetical protein